MTVELLGVFVSVLCVVVNNKLKHKTGQLDTESKGVSVAICQDVWYLQDKFITNLPAKNF